MQGSFRQPRNDSVDLVTAARGGSRKALGELYRRYAGMVYAIALGELRGPEAQDVVQETFLKAMRRLPTLKDPASFGAWLAAIARNTARNIRRARRETGALEDEPPVPGGQHERIEARAALAAIRTLPAAYRETLLMRLVQGMTGPEIADRTGLTAASVRVNLHRGMKMLRDRLASGATGEDE